MKVIKPLYSVPKANAYWFITYHTHHINKLFIMESTYDFCLLYINGNDKSFEIVGLQTDDILILPNDIFAAAKEKELKEAKLLAKDREKLTLHIFIKFNKGYIRLADDNSLFLSQKKQCQCLRLITIKEPIDLMSSCEKIRKVVTLNHQYVVQKARGAYIATIS